ncbi:MAG: phosphatase PAP2 family protein [Desulfobacterales bacterium]|nr:phosphatase PAP2 family protein [Desulfobacterales bacterium]
MKFSVAVFLVITLLIPPSRAWAADEIIGRIGEIKDTIYEDYRNFYAIENLEDLAMGIGMAGVLANTSIDGEIQGWDQESLRNKDTDEFSATVKPFGDGRITVPVYLGAAILGELTKDTKVGSTTGEWGKRSLRAILVGAPPMLCMQRALGASRPKEDESYWRPLNDSNGVSGHSFMGAVPFITAARITENPYLRYLFYLGSMLTGWSRINDNSHYFSQAALGWWMAYLAAACGDKAETEKRKVVIAPTPVANGVGFTVALRF